MFVFFQLFVNNQTSCLKITETQIKKIVLLACEYQEKSPEYLDLLYTLVKVEGLDLNIKRNQSLVIKYIMQNYRKSAYVLEKPRNERYFINNSRCHRGRDRMVVGFMITVQSVLITTKVVSSNHTNVY
jgi:hypothetical protein